MYSTMRLLDRDSLCLFTNGEQNMVYLSAELHFSEMAINYQNDPQIV